MIVIARINYSDDHQHRHRHYHHHHNHDDGVVWSGVKWHEMEYSMVCAVSVKLLVRMLCYVDNV